VSSAGVGVAAFLGARLVVARAVVARFVVERFLDAGFFTAIDLSPELGRL
jgi:hypothetical protein